MRSSASIAAVALALLQGTNAMNAAIQRKFNLLADMGMNPDGTPMATLEEVFVPMYMFHRYQVEAAAKVVERVQSRWSRLCLRRG